MPILLYAIIVINVAFMFTLVAWVVSDAKRERRAHEERMQMLQLAKASSLQEFQAATQKAPRGNTNYFVQQLKKSAYGGAGMHGNGEVDDDGEDDGGYDENVDR